MCSTWGCSWKQPVHKLFPQSVRPPQLLSLVEAEWHEADWKVTRVTFSTIIQAMFVYGFLIIFYYFNCILMAGINYFLNVQHHVDLDQMEKAA